MGYLFVSISRKSQYGRWFECGVYSLVLPQEAKNQAMVEEEIQRGSYFYYYATQC